MDTGESYRYVNDAVLPRAQCGNILIFSDGGLRRRRARSASTAWVAYLVDNSQFTLLAFEGATVVTTSAFCTELFALDAAVEFFSALCD